LKKNAGRTDLKIMRRQALNISGFWQRSAYEIFINPEYPIKTGREERMAPPYVKPTLTPCPKLTYTRPSITTTSTATPPGFILLVGGKWVKQ
jgi:hypothetical protein